MLWMQVPIAALKVAIWQDPIGNFPEKAFLPSGICTVGFRCNDNPIGF